MNSNDPGLHDTARWQEAMAHEHALEEAYELGWVEEHGSEPETPGATYEEPAPQVYGGGGGYRG